MSLATQTAAALLEFERLGRLSDKTREALTESLADEAAARVVEVGDTADDPADEPAADTTTKPAAKAAGTSKGASK